MSKFIEIRALFIGFNKPSKAAYLYLENYYLERFRIKLVTRLDLYVVVYKRIEIYIPNGSGTFTEQIRSSDGYLHI